MLKNWHKKFEKIWPLHLKVSKIFILMGSYWVKYIFFELKKYRGIIFHETEERYKIWRGINLLLQIWHKEFDKIWPEHLKVSKIFILMGSYWVKYILFELKKNREIIFHETECIFLEKCKIWRGINLLLKNWHKEFDKIWPLHLKVSKIFILMGSYWVKYILFDIKKNRGIIFHEKLIPLLKRDKKFEEESTCRFIIDINNLTNFDMSTQKSQKFSF